ncbi:receptor-type tyrosine- phosphatase C-like protein [Labeo rohita]|uniref:Receptor-type tyrosine-phosphatase C-like protein n=1 Tax=Labeo rohita TaxID=84645 RepID=A0A498P7Y7_LABRO|nr:receptor-type tyrosine- phosphatase C-like protein [Labeo rohita]
MNVDMPPVKPEIRFNPTVPSQFEWTNKPARCNPVLEVICTHGNEKETYGLNVAQFLSLNEQYTCTGEYPYQKRLIKSNSLSFQIPCDNRKAVVGFLAFLITVTSVVLFLIYLHKRKRICQHKNGEDEESVYVNVPIRLHKM